MIFIRAYDETGKLPEFSRTVNALNTFAQEVSRAWKIANVSVSELELNKFAWPLRFVESLEQEGALGFHDEEGNLRPEMLVGLSECQKYGVTPSSVAAHEIAEALVDPHLNTCSFDGRSKFWATEVGDPVQAESYSINGVEVSNFVKPNWFNPEAKGSFDKLGNLSAPFTIATGGYSQYIDLNNPKAGWQQVGAEMALPTTRKRTAPTAPASVETTTKTS